ncbi:MAG: TRAP transporter large permease subunit [SAR324 cluster bacterium]|nr:TRAP transporter large permease subunit [SAR324 cluster bacterium]
MDPLMVGTIGLGILVLLLIVGMPIGISMLLVGFGGLWINIGGEAALDTLGRAPASHLRLYPLLAIPLFITMGYLSEAAGYSRDAFHAARHWIGMLRGGLAMGSVAGCAMFAAASGSSTATAAAVGKIAIPEMMKLGYKPELAAGSVASAGTLGIMIPPSIPLVIYAVIAKQSIAKLLLAGIVPGILLALAFTLTIVIWVKLRPDAAPGVYESTWPLRLKAVQGLIGIASLILLVIGGIFFGVWTPTEASAGGAFGALVLGLAQRRMGVREVYGALKEAATTISSITIILLGSLFLSQFIAVTGLAFWTANFLAESDLPLWLFFVGITCAYLILGAFMDGLSFMLLTVPLVLPSLEPMGLSPIWFGVYITLMIELGLITPPVGTTVYVTKSVIPELQLGQIFRGIIPFFFAALTVSVIIFYFPQIALWLPELMSR